LISALCAILILVLQIALIVLLTFIKIRIYTNALLCMYNNVIHLHFYSTVQKQRGENKMKNVTLCSYKPTYNYTTLKLDIKNVVEPYLKVTAAFHTSFVCSFYTLIVH
jgi:hypothetical protein